MRRFANSENIEIVSRCLDCCTPHFSKLILIAVQASANASEVASRSLAIKFFYENFNFMIIFYFLKSLV